MSNENTLAPEEEIEKNESPVEIPDPEGELQVVEDELQVVEEETGETEAKKDLTEFMDLLQVVRFPASAGSELVKKHSVKVWALAIGALALMKGFFALCFYHGVNQEILSAFVKTGTSIINGIQGMSDDVIAFLDSTITHNLSKIPLIGESVSEAADQYISDYMNLLVTSITNDTTDLLTELYQAIHLPEGIGFLMGILTSLIGIGLCALVLKLFLVIVKHPFRTFPEIFSLLAVRSVVCIPILLIAAILSVFVPAAGAVLLPLAALFGMCYMFAVMFKSNDKMSENRFVYLLPFVIILMMIISVLTGAIEGAVAGVSIHDRLDVFFQTLQQSVQ